MLIGSRNHPASDVAHAFGWMAELGLDYSDLTLEPPMAASWQVDAKQIRKLLQNHKMGVVGHTAYYLPIASPFEELRRTALAEFVRCLEIFAEVGARWMNIHPDTDAPLHLKQFLIDRNIQSLDELLAHGKRVGVGIMIENIPGKHFNSAADLGILLKALPDVGLHLDIGHCNLSPVPGNAEAILEAHGHRLRHVHLHDNKGGEADLHLPLGAGTMDIARIIKVLKATGYDGTITLEVFSPDRHYLEHSRNLLRRMWDAP